MTHLIVSEKYETIKNLYDYSVEEFLALFEIILVDNANRALEMKKLKKEK